MSNEVKFSEEELKSLVELQKEYLDVQSNFGQLAIAKLNLQKQANELNKLEGEYKDEFLVIQEKEKQIVEEFTKKYGEGTLDPKSGVFTPIESK